MNNKIAKFVIFISGATIGSLITWQITKNKYDQIAKEEINSIKEAYARKKSSVYTENEDDSNSVIVEKSHDEENVRAFSKEDLDNFKDMIDDLGYSNGYKLEPDPDASPYVIPPHEFSMRNGYNEITLYYYADGILADDDGEKLEDVEGTIGLESLNHFGEYEDDSVCVRNDRLHCDYEILLDARTYAESIKNKPHLKEEE